jgi:2-deoxy-D-gluconate 3-dehydrogenase
MAPSILDMFSLAGRTAMFTGGTRGIGASMAVALAEAGSDIILIQVVPSFLAFMPMS